MTFVKGQESTQIGSIDSTLNDIQTCLKLVDFQERVQCIRKNLSTMDKPSLNAWTKVTRELRDMGAMHRLLDVEYALAHYDEP